MEVSKVVHTNFVISNGPGCGEKRDGCHASPFLSAGTLDQCHFHHRGAEYSDLALNCEDGRRSPYIVQQLT